MTEQGQEQPARWVALRNLGIWIAVTAAAFVIHGYHPFSEDGGIYAAGVKLAVNPSLYPHSTRFVEAHLGMTMFVPAMRALLATTRLPLPWLLLVLQVLSIGITLYGVWEIARRCFGSIAARCGAVGMTAVALTLPIAGTSLCYLDPYVTARSFSTPLTLLAVGWLLGGLRGERRAYWYALTALIVAGLFHPLMAAYATGGMVFLFCAYQRRWKLAGGLIGLALATAFAVRLGSAHATEAYEAVVKTRNYWFLARWHWYEVFGAVAPLGIFGVLCGVRGVGKELRALVTGAGLLGALGLLVSVCCVHAESGQYFVARLQPLRTMHFAYGVLMVALGGMMGAALSKLRERKMRVAAFTAIYAGLAAISATGQRNIYVHSHSLEMPRMQPKDPWSQAFVWVRLHTPADATFALDADYITQQDEDAQCFRAIAERSSLPDYSKDGGVASLAPAMAEEWVRGQRAQSGLSRMSEDERAEKMVPLGVTWLVLRADAVTLLPCEYSNGVVKVCRMTPGPR